MTQQSNPGSAQREVVLARVFDAPRDLVFKAWTEPERLARWWGPNGFTNPVCEVDPQPGGAMRIVMRGPDGSEVTVSATFVEVAPPERLVFQATGTEASGEAFVESLTTVTFEDDAGKTRLTVAATGRALSSLGIAGLEGMEQGWSESLNRLVAEVASNAGGMR